LVPFKSFKDTNTEKNVIILKDHQFKQHVYHKSHLTRATSSRITFLFVDPLLCTRQPFSHA